MGIISNAILIISGVYLALGLMYLRFWWAERAKLSYLAFTISCLSYAIYAWFELGMIHAGTPENYLFYAWWAFVVGGVGITAFAWFGYLHLQGRKWLFLLYAAMRGLALVLHLTMANGINFRQITSVGNRSILGETLSYPVPDPNPWMVLPHLSHVVLIILFLDASVRCWRRGEHRIALIFGTGTILFGTATLIIPTSVLWGLTAIPLFSSYYILFIVIPMLYELNYDMHRAAMLGEELEKRDARLAEIVANVPGIVWESRTDDATKIRKTTFISDHIQEMLGYTPEEWLAEQPGLKILAEEDRERVMRESDEAVETGKDAVSEFRWIRKDGRIRWVENHLSPIVEEAGIVGLRGVALDVTERKAAEQALRESEAFNHTILSSLNTHVCVLDRDGRIISVNQAWSDFALDNGLASDASVGRGVSYLDVCRKAAEGADLAQVALDGVKAVCDGTKEYFDLEYPCHSPTEKRWFLMTVTPLKGDRGGAVVVHNDITDRKLAAEEVRESKERLAETLDQLQMSAVAGNVGLWTREIGGDQIWVSEKAGEIWGFPRGEEVTRETFFQNVHPGDRELFFRNVRELDEGKNEFHLEYRVVTTDGNIRWIHSRGKVGPVNGDRVVRGAIVDITKLKMAEEAIHELSHKLMDAQEKERARLARELHDDLSQSIALLSIQLTTLANDPKDLEHVKDKLERYVSDVERLATDVHRISHELHPAKLTQLGLEAALGGFCRELAAAHPLEISFEAEDLPRDLPQDISLCLYRVAQESLRNIVKHSGAASAKVGVKLENGHVRLSVTDDGNGFDPLAAKEKEALGLISIDERVRAVNGEAKFTSAVGGGTKIEVQIPVRLSG